MGRMLLSIISIGFIVGATLGGQERPDFTGTWVMDASRSETLAQAPDASPNAPVTLKITQSADRLIIETQVDGRSKVTNYSYGAPDATARPVGTTGSNQTRIDGAFASWNGDKLETRTELTINGQAVSQIATYSIDPTAGEMTVQTHVVVHHGYVRSGGGQDPSRNAVKDVYAKRAH